MPRLQRRNIHHIFAPDKGLAQDMPPTLIPERNCPECNNIKFRFGEASKSAGYVKFGSDGQPLSWDGTAGLRVMALINFATLSNVVHYLALTLEDAFLYDSSKKRWRAMGLLVEDCEDAWTAAANVADAQDTGQVGTYSRKLTTSQSGGFSAGDDIAYENLAPTLNLSADNKVHFWFKSDTALDAGDVVLRFSDDAAIGTGNDYADVNVPAVSADAWYYFHLDITLTDLDSCDSVGLTTAAGFPDSADVNIWIDDIRTSTKFTNTKDDQWTWCSQAGAGSNQEASPEWYLIMTNGIDTPFTWDGADPEFTALTGTLGTGALTTSRVAISYKDTLCFMYNEENGNTIPQRLRFGDTAEEDDWNSGVAGYIDCYDTPGGILAATVLGPYMVIYKTDGVALAEYNAELTPVFEKNPRITGSQFFATKAVSSTNNVDYYLARDNVYAYTGLHEAIKIGDPVSANLLENLDFAEKDECFSFIQPGKHRVTFVIPAKETTTYTHWYTYNVLEKTWAKGKWADYITCAGLYEGGEGTSWGQLGVTWANLLGTWGDLVQEKGDKTVLLGDKAGFVYQLADTLTDYDGDAMSSEWHTKDFALSPDYMSRNMRFGKFAFTARGNQVSVAYSTDEGVNWTTLATDQALLAARRKYSISLNFSSNRTRFKFYDATAGKNFYISQIAIEYMSTTTRD